jgi:transcriptional regulator with XRE-family HTH domain
VASQLWQRLRAARKFADMTQAQLAAVCNVTRSGYAFFESSDDNARTRPNTDQIMAIAKLTKVPIEWLLNDTSDPGDVWKIGVVNGFAAKPIAPVSAHDCPIKRPDRRDETFWRAVEYHVTMQDPHRAEAFEASVPVDSIELKIRYQYERVLCCFCSASDPQMLSLFMGRLLLYERALQRTMHKHLVVWPRDGHEHDLTSFIEAAQKGFGISIQVVHTADEAAAYLLAQK